MSFRLSTNRMIAIAIVFSALVWLLTFVVAISSCTVAEFITFRCTRVGIDLLVPSTSSSGESLSKKILELPVASNPERRAISVSEAPDPSALKGQFGDFFGVANSLFSAITFVLVLGTFMYQHQQLNEQQANLVRERYLSEVDKAVSSYNRVLQSLQSKQRTLLGEVSGSDFGVHALNNMWRAQMLQPGIDGELGIQNTRGYPTSFTKFPAPFEGSREYSIWAPIAMLYGHQSSIDDGGISFRQWVRDAIAKMDAVDFAEFSGEVGRNFRKLYGSQYYQLDTLIRTFLVTCKVLEGAQRPNLPSEITRRATDLFFSSVSEVEAKYFLSHEIFNGGHSEGDMRRAVEALGLKLRIKESIDPIACLLDVMLVERAGKGLGAALQTFNFPAAVQAVNADMQPKAPKHV